MSPSTTRFLTLPGGERLAYDHRPGSTGSLVLWLHGFTSSRRSGKAAYLADRLTAAGHGWAAVDFRGHGESDGTLQTLTGTRHLEDARLALVELGRAYDRVALVGSSLGGWAAAWTALREPDRVHKLALLAPALNLYGRRGELGAARLAEWQRLGSIRLPGPTGALLDYNLVDDLARYPEAELTRSLRVPTLILHGMKDPIVPWRGSLTFAESCRQTDVELVLYSDADHLLMSRLSAIGDSLIAFLAR